MQTETRVVMLTDMKGYTAATSRQTREENERMLRLHDALLSPVIAAFGGRRIKSIGDAFLVLFAAPTEAVLCAAAIEDRLADHAGRVVESERIEVRIALTMGEVRLDGGDVFGEPVNLASRLEGLAESGEIWFSESVYWAVDRSRVPVEELGWRAVAGLKEEVRLFRVARAVTLAPGDPPYARIGLGLVAGLPPPEPARLLKRRASRRPGVNGDRLLGRGLVILLLLSGLAAGGWWWSLGSVERAVRLGSYETAREELERLQVRRGADDPELLFLHGRLEAARADAGVGGSLRTACRDWSRALAGGWRPALGELEREGRSTECYRRRLAAAALGESRSREAIPALQEMARAELPGTEPQGALERLKRAVAGDGRCGAGDLAREALARLEGRP